MEHHLFPALIIANKIVSAGSGAGQPFELREVQVVAVTVLALYLVARGITDLVYHIATIVYLQRQNPELTFIPASVIGGVASAATEVIVGAILCIGAKGALRIIERMRQ